MSENRVDGVKNRKQIRPRKLNFSGSRAVDQNITGLKQFRTIYGDGSRFIDDVDVIHPKPKKVQIVFEKIVGNQSNKENERTSDNTESKRNINRQHASWFQNDSSSSLNSSIESKKKLFNLIQRKKKDLVDLFDFEPPQPSSDSVEQEDATNYRVRALKDLNKNKSKTSSENVDDPPLVFNKKSRNAYTKTKKPVASRSSNTDQTGSKSKKNVRKEAENEIPMPVVPEKKMKLSANYRIPKLGERQSVQIQTIEEQFDRLNEI